MQTLFFQYLIFFVITALSLSPLVDAAPQKRTPPPLVLEPRKPPQKAAPGCPTGKFAHRLVKYSLRSFYDDSIAKEFAKTGGYNGFTEGWFWDNFTITDETPNYPAKEKGKKLPAPGKWAKSRRQFGDTLTRVLPEIRKVLGDVRWDENELYFGGMDDKDCLTGFWTGTYIATLKKPYGGKKTGTKVSWKHYHTIKLRKAINDPNASFMIQNATVQMDWSAFYRA